MSAKTAEYQRLFPPEKHTNKKMRRNYPNQLHLNAGKQSKVYSNLSEYWLKKRGNMKSWWHFYLPLPQCPPWFSGHLDNGSPHFQCGTPVLQKAQQILFSKNCVCLFWPIWEQPSGLTRHLPFFHLTQDSLKAEKWLHRGHSLKTLKRKWTTHCHPKQKITVKAHKRYAAAWEERVFGDLVHWKAAMCYWGISKATCMPVVGCIFRKDLRRP